MLHIGIQLVERIKAIHARGIIHRDIKPQNFLTGNTKNEFIYTVDFGLAKCYRDIKGTHIPFKETQEVIGTLRYMSINAHNGNELSRRDDLESIGYVLLYFLIGKLPWQDIQKSKAKTQREWY